MDLTELRAAISSYTENEFSNTDLDTFIVQAEQRINNSVQLPAARQSASRTATPGANLVVLPTDFLAMYSVAVLTPGTNAANYLLQKEPNFIQEAFPFGSYTGMPTHYAQLGASSILIGPMPDVSYAMELIYFGYPPSITTAVNSWLGDNFSSVLLYGSLVEAYTFMKGEQDMMAVYDTKFKEALAMLKQLVDAKFRQDSYRAGQVRYPVT